MSTQDDPASGAVASTLAEQRARARALSAEIEAGRDRIAELDLEIEDRLAAIGRFDLSLRRQLRGEQRALDRTLALARMLERWTVALEERAPEAVVRAGEDIEARRVRELEERWKREEAEDAEEPGDGDEPDATHEDGAGPQPEPAPTFVVELKTAYRQLARRYHPDLARTEEDRVEFGRVMARINAAYHAGDLERLSSLIGGVDPQRPDIDHGSAAELAARLEELTTERAEVARVLEDLEQRRADVEKLPTHRLWVRWRDAAAAGQDFFATMAEQLRERTRDARNGLASAIVGLEHAVDQHNHRPARNRAALVRQSEGGLARVFDPQAGQALARLLLDELEIDRSDPRVVMHADRIEQMAIESPPLVRLLLLAYVAQLSALPLPGLEKHEDHALRFDYLGRDDVDPMPITDAMAELADVLEFGVRWADADKVRTGFRFRSEVVLAAMPLALLRPPVRRELRRVLQVLGEATYCSECKQDVFLIPLFRSIGFDSLRAVVCPACGHAHQRYWLPKGDDVQALLNPAYLELEIVSEWGYWLGGERGATQLLPVELDAMTVGELKQRIHADLFERYDIEVRRGQLHLLLHDRRIPEKTALASLDHRDFTIRFAKGAEPDEADVAQQLRHRIRHRFD